MNIDTLPPDELNKLIAELRGWKLESEHKDGAGNLFSYWRDNKGHIQDLPDIAGDDHAALDACKWMKERGWNYTIHSRERGHTVIFGRSPVLNDGSASLNQPTLSLAIARAMARALESEKKK